MIKKIISFSLWGNNPKYTIGAIRNATLAPEIYPRWEYRFYVGDDVKYTIIEELQRLGSTIVPMNGSGWNGMFWRFLAADSDDIVISRDTDSRLSLREKAAVDEWLNSDKDFHIMRDHPYHATEILGGMWGCRNGIIKGISQWINDYEKNDSYQVDQSFLKKVIYPIVKTRSIVHDEFFGGGQFPIPRHGRYDFVGQVYDENNNPKFRI